MAVRFDAAESFNVTLTLGNQSAYTVTCWVKISVDRGTYSSPWSTDNGSEAFVLGTNVDGTTMSVYDDIIGSFVATGPDATVGVWYYYAVVVNGSSGTLYWRAATANTLSSATWTAGTRNITRLIIGDDPYTEWLNGCIAGFKFWTGALSLDEVSNESWQYFPRRTANLVTFYPFVRTETTDYSGNGRTLTGGATTTTEDGPPIPWSGIQPRIVLPTTVAGSTSANAEAASYAVTANDPAPSIKVSAECATFGLAVNDSGLSASSGAECAALAVAAVNVGSSLLLSAESALWTLAANDGAATVGEPANALAECATFGVTASDPATSIAPTGDCAILALLAGDLGGLVVAMAESAAMGLQLPTPAQTVGASSQGADVALAAVDAATAILAASEPASWGLDAWFAVALSGTVASAQPAAVALAAGDLAGTARAGIESAALELAANDASAVASMAGTALAESAAIAVTANPATVALGLNASTAALELVALDQSSVVALVSEACEFLLTAYMVIVGGRSGSMDGTTRPIQSMSGMARTTAGMNYANRNHATMSGRD